MKLFIIEKITKNIVKTYDMNGKPHNKIDKIEMGIEKKLDHKKYYISRGYEG